MSLALVVGVVWAVFIAGLHNKSQINHYHGINMCSTHITKTVWTLMNGVVMHFVCVSIYLANHSRFCLYFKQNIQSKSYHKRHPWNHYCISQMSLIWCISTYLEIRNYSCQSYTTQDVVVALVTVVVAVVLLSVLIYTKHSSWDFLQGYFLCIVMEIDGSH